MRSRPVIVTAGVAALVILVAGVIRARRGPAPAMVETAAGPVEPPDFVGRATCVRCHERQAGLWEGSHHDLAMDPATARTVLGDFDDATLTHEGVTSTFFVRDGLYYVRTDGPDGDLHEYPIKYTFGVAPLQQYLVEFPGGRLQTLSLCWDTRPAESGGQRWFHLYPDERIASDDPLHWTGPNQTWNSMCAECHSTNLEKGYDLAQDRYTTTWSEIDVACEACHGPGSNHVAWATAPAGATPPAGDTRGLAVRLKDTDGGAWVFDMETGTAKRSVPREEHTEVEACGRCHARRSPIAPEYTYGRPLADTHRVRLLDEGLYHADGQIRDEVYVYGSFLQSRMHREGVTCKDCHEPHGLKLHAPGNAVCYRCHLADRFDTPEHHHHDHDHDTSPPTCVDCHMPETTYMVVDPRRDHSIRPPRPDLSVTLGTPNACTGCHRDQSAQWAADAVERWYGPVRRRERHYGEAIHAGRVGAPGADAALAALAADPEEPAIVHATAIALLGGLPGPVALAAIERSLADPSPLVRAAAVGALETAGPPERRRLAAPLLDDDVRLVRIQAARLLAPVPRDWLTAGDSERLRAVIGETIDSDLVEADRPETHLRLGVLYADLGRPADAEAAYRTALRLQPASVEARVNLADLYRLLGRDDEGERFLREALEIAPDRAAVHHALGLLLHRRGRGAQAIASLGRAADLAPAEPRFIYVYAIALRDAGLRAEAEHQARRLLELTPADPAAARLLADLEAH